MLLSTTRTSISRLRLTNTHTKSPSLPASNREILDTLSQLSLSDDGLLLFFVNINLSSVYDNFNPLSDKWYTFVYGTNSQLQFENNVHVVMKLFVCYLFPGNIQIHNTSCLDKQWCYTFVPNLAKFWLISKKIFQ